MGDEFDLNLEPNDKIVFAGKDLGEEPVEVTLKIKNPTKERQILKVKCTSNEMFRIRPPVFAMAPNEEVVVNLAYEAGNTIPDSGKHYFAVYYIKADTPEIAPRDCWAAHKGESDGVKRLYVDFKKEGGEEKEADVKEGDIGSAENKEGENKEGENKEEGNKEGENKEGEEKKEGGEKKEDEAKKEGEEKKEGGEKKEEEKKG
ncbi:hypothetical protein AB6A40_006436 [Gnathostoma spinigerum]|uniref:Major sperm protein n=1 Tax=Gnathostoma spinigerum TaxID=75299 RepID=A0ABD6ESS0_9BILA